MSRYTRTRERDSLKGKFGSSNELQPKHSHGKGRERGFSGWRIISDALTMKAAAIAKLDGRQKKAITTQALSFDILDRPRGQRLLLIGEPITKYHS